MGTRYITWKEKHLDYEIETKVSRAKNRGRYKNLKRKASRLRDWNVGGTTHNTQHTTHLKRKASRLRDWNYQCYSHQIATCEPQNTWKEKHLDYEIETEYGCPAETFLVALEKKSISITRLKPEYNIGYAYRPGTWKEKHLDYEIETCWCTIAVRFRYSLPLKRKASRLRDWNNRDRLGSLVFRKLEKKSISITRLKLFKEVRKSWGIGCTWKEKHLDYEIETIKIW